MSNIDPTLHFVTKNDSLKPYIYLSTFSIDERISDTSKNINELLGYFKDLNINFGLSVKKNVSSGSLGYHYRDTRKNCCGSSCFQD